VDADPFAGRIKDEESGLFAVFHMSDRLSSMAASAMSGSEGGDAAGTQGICK